MRRLYAPLLFLLLCVATPATAAWWSDVHSDGSIDWSPVAGTDYYAPGSTDVAIADGGTGASTAVAAFNALSPVTTRGDLIVRDASNNVRLALGATYKCLTSNGTDAVWSSCLPLVSQQTINPASCAASSVCLTAVTVTNAAANDACVVAAPAALLAGTAVNCYVSAANTVQLQVINPTTTAKDVASGTFTFYLGR